MQTRSWLARLGVRDGRPMRPLALLLVGLAVALPRAAAAHTPHDAVGTPVQFSQDFVRNGTMFVLLTGSLLRSTDGGRSWHLVDGGRPALGYLQALMLVDGPAGDSLIAAGADRLVRSDDGGVGWRDVSAGLAVERLRAFGTQMSAAGRRALVGGDDGLFASEPGGSWRRLLEQPVSILGVGNDAPVPAIVVVTGDQALLSADDGATWTARQLELDAGETVTAAHVLASNVYLGTSQGRVLRLGPEGPSETVLYVFGAEDAVRTPDAGDAPSAAQITSIASGALGEGRWQICASASGVVCSNDLGNTWSTQNLGLTIDVQAFGYAGGVHFPAVAMAPGFDASGLVFLSGFDGLFRSTDYGSTWRQADVMRPNLIYDIDQIVLESGQHCVVFSTDSAGAYLSSDGGESWEIVNFGLPPKMSIYDVDFLPSASSCTQLVATTFMGPMLWDAERATWQPWFTHEVYSEIFNGKFRGGLYWRAMRKLGLFDYEWPFIASRIDVRTGPDASRRALLATLNGSLFAADGIEGAWQPRPHQAGAIYDAQLSPDVAADRTLFLVVADRVVRSTDDGATWHDLPIRLPDWPDYHHWGVPRLHLSQAFARDGTLYATSAAGLGVSQDRGDSWSVVDLPAPCTDQAVHAFEWLQDDSEHGGSTYWITVRGCGMFRREGDGAWQRLDGRGLPGIGELRSLSAGRSADGEVLLLGADEQALYASTDGGSTWSYLPAPVRIEDVHDTWVFQGAWSERSDRHASSGTVRASDERGATADLPFQGRAVRILARRAEEGGALRIYVDGEPRADLECAAGPEPVCASEWVDGLARGWHDLVVEVRAAAAGGSSVQLDAVDVVPE